MLNPNIVKTLFLLALISFALPGISQQYESSQLDLRARNHYTAAEVNAMTPLKIAQINFIYQQSFFVNTEKPCLECPSVNLQLIDVSTLERKQYHRARIYQTVPGHPIELLSYEELDAKLQQIANEFNTVPTSH